MSDKPRKTRRRKQRPSSVFVYFDISGSVPENLFIRFLFEAEQRRQVMEYETWNMFCFDTDVIPYRDYMNSGGRLGHGGTDIQKVEEHFLTNAWPGCNLLLFSDGYIPTVKRDLWKPKKGFHEFVFATGYADIKAAWAHLSNSKITLIESSK